MNDSLTPLQTRLARLQNFATRYELVAANGSTQVLAGYTAQKSRNSIFKMIRQQGEAWQAFAKSDSFAFGKKASDGATLGAWTIRFSGRTQRDAYIGGELPWFADLVTPQAVAA